MKNEKILNIFYKMKIFVCINIFNGNKNKYLKINFVMF